MEDEMVPYFTLTWSHLIVAVLAIAIYDLSWNLLAHDDWSDCWFQRRMVATRLMIFGATITLIVVASMDLLVAGALTLGLVIDWWLHASPLS